jgi:hypothetical protein
LPTNCFPSESRARFKRRKLSIATLLSEAFGPTSCKALAPTEMVPNGRGQSGFLASRLRISLHSASGLPVGTGARRFRGLSLSDRLEIVELTLG